MSRPSPGVCDAKKGAKILLKMVKQGDPGAVDRARAATRNYDGATFCLMKAQHVIARERGYADWGDLRRADT